VKHMCSNLFNPSGTGFFTLKVRAMNDLSTSDVDVDLEKILQACQNYSDSPTSPDGNIVCISINSRHLFTLVYT